MVFYFDFSIIVVVSLLQREGHETHTLEYQIIVEHQIIVDSGTLGMKINRVGIKLSWTVDFSIIVYSIHELSHRNR